MKISTEKVAGLFAAGELEGEKLADAPLYNRVYQGLRGAILSGDLPFNCELPPTRTLAEAMAVSRSTIIKSYELLRLEGLISSKTGSGSLVTYLAENPVQPTGDPDKSTYPALSQTGEAYLGNRELVNPLDDNYISFRPGLPPLDVFPVEQWKKQSNRYWSMIRASELTYHSAMGMDSLRISLANYLNLTRHIRCDYRQVVIVGGSVQSLFLIGNLLLDPGDGVILEEHTFPNVHSVMRGLRARLTAAPLDEEGIRLQDLGQAASGCKLMHITPSCQYPLGMQMSLQRRRDVVDFANCHELYLIENDYEHDVNRALDPINSVFSMDPHDRTFYVSTFNRILHPSIRLGFMIVPLHLVDAMEALIRHSHMFISPSIQMVLRSFLENKTLHKHIARVNKSVSERREIFAKALLTLKGTGLKVEIFRIPSLHLLIHLPDEVSDISVVRRLKEQGVLVHALSKCAVTPRKKQGLIVGFASTRPQQMPAKLAVLIHELQEIV